MHNLGLSFSRESLEATAHALTVDTAVRMIGLAGNTYELESLLRKLARTFGATIPQSTFDTIRLASKRWHAVPTSRGMR